MVLIVGIVSIVTVLLAGRSLTARPDPVEPVTPAYAAGVAAIDETDLRSWIGFLAAPELAGRASGEVGYDVASRFCATVLERYGVAPHGDEREGGGRSYFQGFHLVERRRSATDSSMTWRSDGTTHRWKLGSDFKPTDGDYVDVDWKGPWTIVLVGKDDRERVHERLKEAGQEGRQAIVFFEEPGVDNVRRALPRGKGESQTLVVSDAFLQAQRRDASRRVPLFLEKQRQPSTPPRRVVAVSESVGSRLLEALELQLDELPPVVGGEVLDRVDALELSVVVKTARHELPTRNVVGRIEGSDPELRDEYVAIGAHLDHVGHHGEEIFYGADDNASGSAAVLSVARAFHANRNRPRRSVILLLFAAEELGLHGSNYFVENAPVPVENIVAYVNLDMIGRDESRPGKEKAEDNRETVHLVGSRKHNWHFHRLVVEQNRMIGLEFEYDQENVFRRSDQYHFHRKGIPVAFFFAGFHPDYHRPTDTVEKLNYDKVERVARLSYVILHRLADRPGRFEKLDSREF